MRITWTCSIVIVLLNDDVYERNCRGEFFFGCAYIHAGGSFLVLNVLYVRCRLNFLSLSVYREAAWHAGCAISLHAYMK
jgi:hypothetical protein